MKKIDFEFETEITIPVKVVVKEFTPERPSPVCSNPSSPLYSDPGDPADWSDVEIILGDVNIIDYLTDDVFEFIDGEIISCGDEEIEASQNDAMWERYESQRDR